MADAIQLFIGNFSLAMLILAIVLAVLVSTANRGTPTGAFREQLFRWTALLAVGITGIYTFVCHVFFAESTAAHIGWQTSPFQYEVGIADLTVGLLGLLAFWGNVGFRWAATLATTVWLWGDAVGHVRQMIVAHNYAPGNAGSWFWTDVLVPLIMIASLIQASRSRPAV
jgi:Family of unknown function (DUF6790)